ncbi:hypothetical protein [Erwinia psidii]|uniref:hypothetical protein n=1 Tax=Erwinia psidii TaxID=69224 RepID=UPI000F530396|nr:hypothetical protein [Erwinia psidii]
MPLQLDDDSFFEGCDGDKRGIPLSVEPLLPRNVFMILEAPSLTFLFAAENSSIEQAVVSIETIQRANIFFPNILSSFE